MVDAAHYGDGTAARVASPSVGVRRTLAADAGRDIGRAFQAPLALASCLVALPSLLFLATHLAEPALAALCIAGAGGALGLVLRDLRPSLRACDGGRFAACLALGFILCLLGGEAHVFYANDDWLIRDAVLGDLVHQSWPVGYTYAGGPNVLRAPLGMYLLPAAIGKALGLPAAHLALLAQNGTLLGCFLHCFAAQARSWRAALVVVAVFVLFSGWDIVGQALFGNSLAFPIHLSRWAGLLQFSGTAVQIFWAPNHAFSGWMFVAAYLAWRHGALGATSLAVIFGFCVFWSPLSAMGALPFAGYALLHDRHRLHRAGLAALALAGLALLPVLLYLGLDFGRVPHGGETMSPDFLLLYLVFETLDLLPFVLLLRFARPDGTPTARTEFAIVIAVLLLVPFFRIGGNDFVMRASVPALALLALRVATLLEPDEARLDFGKAIVVVATLAVGAVTPLYEIGRALTLPAYRVSRCNMLTANRFPPNDAPMFHYVARVSAITGLRGILARPTSFLIRDDAIATCWPDDPSQQRHVPGRVH